MLDRSKSQIAYFLRSLMESNSNFIFNVRSAQGEWEIEDFDDLDAFLDDLAGISFCSPQNENAVTPSAAGEMYVFSTACDTGLNAFILANRPRPVALFFVQAKTKNKEQGAKSKEQSNLRFGADSKDQRAKREEETALLYKRDFFICGCVPKPRWLFRTKIKPAGVVVDKVDMINAETRL
jgi:hypothetical protein